jgi:tape measure domain-containing protein
VSDIGDTVGIGIRLEDDGSVGQYADNLEQLITRAIVNAGETLAKTLQDALAVAARSFAKNFQNTLKVAAGSVSGIADQVGKLDQRLNTTKNTAGEFAKQLNVDPANFDTLVQSSEQLQALFEVLTDQTKNFNRLDLRRLTQQFEGLRRVSIEQLAAFQSVQATIRQESKAASDERRSADRVEIANIRAQTGLEIVARQTASAQSVAELKSATQLRVALIQQETARRVQLFKTATASIQALERSVRSVFDNTAKAISAGFQSLASVAQSAASTIQTTFSRSNRRVVDEYGSSLTQQEQLLKNSVQEQEKTISKFAENANGILSNIGIGRAAGLGIAAGIGAFFGRSLQAGFARFATLQEATRGLDLLLNDATESARLLDGVLDVVRGTPFGLELFADASAQLVTFNVRAKEIPPLLAAIGDAAALKGSRAPEFIGRLVNIFGQISAQGRLTGDNLTRLQEAGVPALQILGNQAGKTALEIRELVSAGAIGDEVIGQLAQGITEGTDGVNGATVAFDGLARSLGQTLRGSIANLGAARARLGAAIIGPFNDAFVAVVGLFTKFTDQITTSIGNLLNALAATGFIRRFSDTVNQLSQNLEGVFERVRPVAAALVRTLIALGSAFVGLNSARIAAGGIKLLSVALGGLLSPFRVLFAAATGVTFVFTRLVRENIRFSTALTFLGESIAKVIRPFREIFTALTDGSSALRRALGGLFEGGLAVLATFVNNVLAPALFGLGLLLRGAVVPAVEGFTERITQFIKSDAGTQLANVFTAVTSAATLFANFVITTVLPVLGRIAAVIGAVVIVAFERFVSLIRDRVIPALEPVVRTLQNFVTTVGTQVPEALKNFSNAVKDAFSQQSFGAIATAFKDLLLGLGPIAAVAGAAVALSFINPFLGLKVLIAGGLAVAFGPQLIQLIQPRLNDIRRRIIAAFSVENLLNVGFNILAVVNRLGRQLGRIVSDPRLLAAVAGIAAVGVALAGSFALGVVQGIADNVPKIVRGIQNLLGKALLEGFKAALTSPLIGAVLVTGLGALLFGPAVIANLKRQTAAQATAIGQNFVGNLRRSFLQTTPLPQNASTFVRGLLGGPQALQAAVKQQVAQTQKFVVQETQRINRTAQASGIQTSFVSNKEISRQLSVLTAQIGPVGIAANLARDSVSRIGLAIRAVATSAPSELGAVATSIRQLNFSQASASARAFGQTATVQLGRVKLALTDLGRSLRVIGPTLFKQAGLAAGAAFATAFASQALFDAESSTADKAGSLAGVAASFAATSAIAGPKVAALATGVGLLGGAFKAAGDRAKEAERRVKEFAEIITQFEDPAGPDAVIAQTEKFIKELSTSALAVFDAAGLNVGSIVSLSDKERADLLELTNTALPSITKRILTFDQAGVRASIATQELADKFGISFEQAEKLAVSLQSLLTGLRDAPEAAANLDRALELDDVEGFFQNVSEGVRDFARSLLNVDGLSLEQVKQRIDDLQRGIPEVVSQFAAFTQGQIDLGDEALKAITELQKFSRVRLEGLREELSQFQNALETIDDVIDTTRQNLRRLLQGEIVDSSAATDAAIIQIQRIGESLEGLAGKQGLAAQAEINTLLRDVSEVAADALQAAIDEAVALDKPFTIADAERVLEPLRQAASETAPGIGDEILKVLDFVASNVPGLELGIDTLRSAENVKKATEDIVAQQQVLIEAEIVFDRTLAKEGAVDLAQEAAAAILGESELFEDIGRQLTEGLIFGIGEGKSEVENSLRALLGLTVQAGRDEIKSNSPSRVAADVIGFPIPQGIAVGINAGVPLVTGAMRNVTNSIISAEAAARSEVNNALRNLGVRGLGQVQQTIEKASETFSRFRTPTFDSAETVRNITNLGNSARGAKKDIEELDLVINDLQRSLLQEFKIFDFQTADPFSAVVFDEGRKELNSLLTSIGGVADQFAKGLRDGTIAGVAQAANAFGEFEQKVIEGLREGIIEGSIQGVNDVNRTLDQIGIVVAQQLGPQNQAAIDEFDKLIGGLRNRSDIEALIIVELEQKALRDAQKKLDELNSQIANLGNLTSRVFRGLLTQLERQFDAAQQNLVSLFDRVFSRAQLPTGPLGLPDIGVIEDYAAQASDALTGIFDRLLGRNQLATEAITGDLDELLATRAEASGRITAGESLIEQLRAESVGIEQELRGVGGGLAESFRTFFERGSAGEAQFRAQARAIGLSATEVENLVAKQRQLRVAQRDIAEAQLLEAETSEKIAEEREKLRRANIELLESSIALLDNGEDGALIFREIANAAGLTIEEIGELSEAYRRLRFEEQAQEIESLAEQDEKLRKANQELLESSLALIDAGPAGITTFREIGKAAGASELEIQQLINGYQELRAVEEQKIAIDLTLQQIELESSIRDSALALQELINLGPEGSDFFNRLAALSGLNVDSARDLILEYGEIVAKNSGSPPSALFEGLKQFTNDNIGITQLLLDKYGNVASAANANAPTRFFASLDGQIGGTASRVAGLASQISGLNAQLGAAEARASQVQATLISQQTFQQQFTPGTAAGNAGSLVNIQNATFQTPSDANRVAGAVNGALASRFF